MRWGSSVNVEAQVYSKDIVLRRKMDITPIPPPKEQGSKIMEMTYKSRARLLFTIKNTALKFQTLITLTYPADYPTDGKSVKTDLKEFLQESRRDLGGYEYIWFLEFQRRGAPHYHLLTTILTGTSWFGAVRKVVSLNWYKAVGSGDPKHLDAGTRVEKIRRPDGATRYVAKYASKKEQKLVPELYQNVGRFWGCSRGVQPLPMFTIETTDSGLLVLLDLAEIPPYSTLFDKADVVMQRVPALLKAQTEDIARHTGESINLITVNSGV